MQILQNIKSPILIYRILVVLLLSFLIYKIYGLEEVANEAKSDAEDAMSIAEEAKSEAEEAKSEAEDAMSKAEKALNEAESAKLWR